MNIFFEVISHDRWMSFDHISKNLLRNNLMQPTGRYTFEYIFGDLGSNLRWLYDWLNRTDHTILYYFLEYI